MKKHVYYRLLLHAESPISVGSGQSTYSDCDIYKDALGNAVIPSTGLTGAIRALLDNQTANDVFGYIQKDILSKSKLIVYDAVSLQNQFVVRDFVGLDENKVAEDGAKFDREIVEGGFSFLGFIEIHGNDYNPALEEAVNTILAKIKAGNLYVGGKQTRGFGKLSLAQAQRKSFDIDTEPDKWLDFDVFDNSHWADAEKLDIKEIADDKHIVMQLKLKQRGGIAIRSYVAEEPQIGQNTVPDYEQLKLSNNTKVIPGTSWAGAFRAQVKKLGGNPENLFGFSKKKEDKTKTQKSSVVFDESQISGGTEKILTRNSIDRFSAGTKDGALFTERSYYNGNTELEIKIDKAAAANNTKELNALLASILDLHNGFMAVGGLTAVGRGLFGVEHLTINNKDYTKELLENNYEKLKEVCR